MTISNSSRHLFTAKAIVVPIAGLTFFIWAIVKAKGVGPIIHQPGTLHGSKLAWAMLSGFGSCMSNMATLIVYVLVRLRTVQLALLISPGPGSFIYSEMPPILPVEHARLLQPCGLNLSASRSDFPLSVSSASLSRLPVKSYTVRPSGVP
jgi:Permease for cytosine/purines, uracil, thiamine, allantoin